MEELKNYIIALDKMESILYDMPPLNYDIKIEGFFENTMELIVEHRKEMLKRLNREEKEKWQQLQQIKAQFI